MLAVCDALKNDDYEMVGKMMYETHYGLSKEYEVSCEELDFLNDVAKEAGVTGSRIMGGGFGGCTINLEVRREVRQGAHHHRRGDWRRCTQALLITASHPVRQADASQGEVRRDRPDNRKAPI